MRWQPIETAPKDGTIVDLFAGKRFADFAFDVDRDAWIRTEKMWRGDHEVCARRYLDLQPTAWMPLPAPPTSSEGGRG